MATLTDYSRNHLLDLTLRGDAFTPPADVYAGILISPGAVDAAGTEPTGGGYARQPVTFNAASGAAIDTDVAAVFDPLHTTDDLYVIGVGLFDAATAGNMLAFETFPQSRLILAGSAATITAGLTVSSRGEGMSDVLATAWLDHLLGGAAYSAPTIDFAVYTVAPTRSTNGTQAAAPTTISFSAASSGVSLNETAAMWRPLDADNDLTLAGWAVTDGTDALFFGVFSADVAVPAGDNVRAVIESVSCGAS